MAFAERVVKASKLNPKEETKEPHRNQESQLIVEKRKEDRRRDLQSFNDELKELEDYLAALPDEEKSGK